MPEAEQCTKCGAELSEGVTNEALDNGAEMSEEDKEVAVENAVDVESEEVEELETVDPQNKE